MITYSPSWRFGSMLEPSIRKRPVIVLTTKNMTAVKSAVSIISRNKFDRDFGVSTVGTAASGSVLGKSSDTHSPQTTQFKCDHLVQAITLHIKCDYTLTHRVWQT